MENTIPICSKIAVRTEFSGVGTAEESVKACVAMFNESIEVDFQSMGDWNAASRYCAEQNLACACRFGDIMELTNESLKSTLLAEKFDKGRILRLDFSRCPVCPLVGTSWFMYSNDICQDQGFRK